MFCDEWKQQYFAVVEYTPTFQVLIQTFVMDISKKKKKKTH